MSLFSRIGSAFAAISLISSAGLAFADERPLIWAPSKSSDTSYAVKLGLRLPSELETEAGIKLGLDASSRGAVVNTPVKVWGRVTASSIQTPAYQLKRDIRLNLDAMTGSSLAGVSLSERRIATEKLDVEISRDYGVHYDGVASTWRGEASQSVKVSRVDSGTAVIVKASALDTFREIGGGISLEQKIGRRLSLNGSIEQTTASDGPTSNLGARYTFKW